MSTETPKWQILSFCNALKLRYSFMGYATLSMENFRIDLFPVDTGGGSVVMIVKPAKSSEPLIDERKTRIICGICPFVKFVISPLW
jgi:hypothetical protein